VNSNLAINIGFDNRATHTKKRNPKIPNKLVKLNEAFTECSEAESKIFDKWEITSESKMINGYKCFKANFSKTQTMLGKEYTNKAIAWFCPDIPVSFGPAEFSGLPGLIFQLQANEYSFVLKNITFESNLKISAPSSGKEMTLDEYLKLSTENMEKLKEMAKSYKE
jgi:GLPGLI family protein